MSALKDVKPKVRFAKAEEYLKRNVRNFERLNFLPLNLQRKHVSIVDALEAIRLARKEEAYKFVQKSIDGIEKSLQNKPSKIAKEFINEIEVRVRVQARDDAIKEMIAFVETEIGCYTDAKSSSMDLMFLREQFKKTLEGDSK